MKKVFNVGKYVKDLKERGVKGIYIIRNLETWALESHGKTIEIDEVGNHYIKGIGSYYSSCDEWEDEIPE